MGCGVIEAAWAKDARNRIETAVSDLNKGRPERQLARLAWGGTTLELKAEHVDYEQQLGLLERMSHDFELTIGHCEETQYFRIEAKFDEPAVLPRDAQSLYNAMLCCDDMFATVRIAVAPDYESGEIMATGVQASVAIDTITGASLKLLLSALVSSHDSLFAFLLTGEGNDSWANDKQFYSDEAEV